MTPRLRRRFDAGEGLPSGRAVGLSLVLLLSVAPAVAVPQGDGASETTGEAVPGQASEDPVRVLFIGHSYYFFNNLPVQLTALAESAGRRIEVKSLARPSATLTSHMDQPETWDAIAKWGADFVILSDNSLLGGRPWRGRRRVAVDVEEFNHAVRRLDAAIAAADARTVLFLNWARKHLPDDQRILNQHYRRIANEVGAIVSPVGPAWRRVAARNRRIDLYRNDGSHPASAGSYLAACVLYSTLFGEPPIGLTSRILGPDPLKVSPQDVVLVDLGDADARLLQETAWTIWTVWAHQPAAPVRR